MSRAVVSIIGNLGGDAEQRYLPSGAALVNFSIAATNRGGKEETTNWYRCTLFGKLGDSLLPYLTKGKQVLVEGPLVARSYQNKDGSNAFSLDVTVNNIELLSRQNEADDDDEETTPAPKAAPKKAAGRPKKVAAPIVEDDDDPLIFGSEEDEAPF